MLKGLKIKIFADGADLEGMCKLYADPRIQGLTTNPTLMRKCGVSDYESFARQVLSTVKTKPISFEVFSDDFVEMKRQAMKIAGFQNNVYVKIPITNTKAESAVPLIRELSKAGVKLNVTAILTVEQIRGVVEVLDPGVASVLSIFAGRIADTGVDPVPIMEESISIAKTQPKAEVLWASVREVLNIVQADACGSHIVTVPHDILSKAMKMGGMDLGALSLDTVKMFAKGRRRGWIHALTSRAERVVIAFGDVRKSTADLNQKRLFSLYRSIRTIWEDEALDAPLDRKLSPESQTDPLPL